MGSGSDGRPATAHQPLQAVHTPDRHVSTRVFIPPEPKPPKQHQPTCPSGWGEARLVIEARKPCTEKRSAHWSDNTPSPVDSSLAEKPALPIGRSNVFDAPKQDREIFNMSQSLINTALLLEV